MLRIAAEVVDSIVAHALEDSPIEACGYLAERDGLIDRVFRLANADASPDHYSLLPAQQFAAVRDMRKSGHCLRGVYHSHPATPARMSEEDLRLAIDPKLAYLIVSLAGAQPEVKAFAVDNGAAIPIDIVVAQPVVTQEER
jgi:proteasome lid subunit RPN8/RPN11